MISFLNRHRKTLFIATISVFLIGTFVGLGGYLFTSNDMTEAVASVGDVKIPYLRYRARVDQYLEALRGRDAEVTDDMAKRVKIDMLRDMIVDEMLLVLATGADRPREHFVAVVRPEGIRLARQQHDPRVQLDDLVQRHLAVRRDSGRLRQVQELR